MTLSLHSPLANSRCCKSPAGLRPQPFFYSSHLSSTLSHALIFLVASYCLQAQVNCLRIASKVCHILVPTTPASSSSSHLPHISFPLASGSPAVPLLGKSLLTVNEIQLTLENLTCFLYLALMQSKSPSLSFLNKYNNCDSDYCY